jgi:hypothetical protein
MGAKRPIFVQGNQRAHGFSSGRSCNRLFVGSKLLSCLVHGAPRSCGQTSVRKLAKSQNGRDATSTRSQT